MTEQMTDADTLTDHSERNKGKSNRTHTHTQQTENKYTTNYKEIADTGGKEENSNVGSLLVKPLQLKSLFNPSCVFNELLSVVSHIPPQ